MTALGQPASLVPAPMDGWRVVPFEVADAGTLLARGRALLEGLADDPTPTLRWYRSATPALVLGRGQGDLAALAAASGIPVVHRFSGGGAVLLDEDLLSLDVGLPAGHPWLAGDPGQVFLHVGQAWAGALATLGVPGPRVHPSASTACRRGTPRERLLAAVCYATVGRGEVTVGGRKLVGLAQRRRRVGALVQCGLVRRWRPGRLLSALGADPDDAEITRAAVGLDELLRPPPDDDAVVTAMSAAVARYSVPEVPGQSKQGTRADG